MSIQAKIGILFVTSGWFRDVGLQSGTSDTSKQIDHIVKKIIHKLGECLQPVFDGVLYSIEDARKTAHKIRSAEVDGLLLAPLMWCEDQIVRAALKDLSDFPIILWTFSPQSSLPDFVPFQTMLQGSGAVCTLQLSGMLKREGYNYHSVVGPFDDDQVFEEIRDISTAMAIARNLRNTRVGLLPFPCAHMSSTYVDEFDLRARYGIELKYLELERFRRTAADITEQSLNAFRQQIVGSGQQIEVDDRNLREGIRYALAMERVIKEEKLDVLATNDVIDEMHVSFGLRPCLSNPQLAERGTVVSMEGDIAAGVAMHILRLATDQAPFYTETFSVDYGQNALLLGHAGYHDSVNADPSLPIKIVSDVEYENSDRFTGAVTYFKYKPGPVTVINSVWDGKSLKWIAFEGESLAGSFKMDGNAHLFCRLDPDVKTFFRTSVKSGVSQHWIVLHGRLLDTIMHLCSALDILFMRID